MSLFSYELQLGRTDINTFLLDVLDEFEGSTYDEFKQKVVNMFDEMLLKEIDDHNLETVSVAIKVYYYDEDNEVEHFIYDGKDFVEKFEKVIRKFYEGSEAKNEK